MLRLRFAPPHLFSFSPFLMHFHLFRSHFVDFIMQSETISVWVDDANAIRYFHCTRNFTDNNNKYIKFFLFFFFLFLYTLSQRCCNPLFHYIHLCVSGIIQKCIVCFKNADICETFTFQRNCSHCQRISLNWHGIFTSKRELHVVKDFYHFV